MGVMLSVGGGIGTWGEGTVREPLPQALHPDLGALEPSLSPLSRLVPPSGRSAHGPLWGSCSVNRAPSSLSQLR